VNKPIPGSLTPQQKQKGVHIMDGHSWDIVVIGGPILLALALAYGLFRWSARSRNPALKQARDQATREIYEKR
jgi:hypothetical protein